MPNERERFLYEVDRLAAKRNVDSATRYALIQELTAHLEASIQARIETDESPLIAEANAVDALGSPKHIVDGLAKVHAPQPLSIHRPLLISIVVGFAIYCTVFFSGRGPVTQVILYGLIGALAWFIFESWRSRRFQALALLVSFVPIWIGLTVAFSSQWVQIDGDEGMMQRSGLGESQSVIARVVDEMKVQDAALMSGYAAYQKTGGLLVPRGFDSQTGELLLRKAPNEEFARRSWELSRETHGDRLANIARESQKLASTIERMNEPFYYQVPRMLVPCLTYALQFLGFLAVVHAAVVFLRWFVAELLRTARNAVRGRQGISTGGAIAASPLRNLLARARSRTEDEDATYRVDTRER